MYISLRRCASPWTRLSAYIAKSLIEWQFAYLGSIIDNTGGTEANAMAHIWKAQIAFSALNKIWRSSVYSMQTKLCIFNTNVKAVLLYGCETWKNSKSITAKLQFFINKWLRKILRIFWPDQTTNKELWKSTKQPRIHLQIRKCKWRWLGHINCENHPTS